MSKPINRGAFHERTKSEHSKIEKALADAWEKENEPNRSIGFGYGLLQDLFCKPDERFGYAAGGTATKVLTDDERMVAATAIQWLGSNCGWAFLQEALSSAGFKIVKKKS